MPRRDGSGPMGAGAMTGRGFGFCTGFNAANYGAGRGMGSGFGCRRGFGRGFGRGLAFNQDSSKTQKDVLSEEKAFLEGRLEAIDKQLENL